MIRIYGVLKRLILLNRAMWRERKLFVGCIVLSFSIFAGAQQGDKTIDYTTKAIPLRAAVEAISKQAGKTLIVDDDISREPVVLRLVHAPLADVKARLAEEFVAEWVPVKDGLELMRTQAALDAFQNQLYQRRLAAFQKSIDELAPLAKSPPIDDNEAHRIAATYVKMLQDEKSGSSTADGAAMRFSLAKRTGDMRLLAAMVVSIGAEKLASLPVGRHVFSLSPTPMQLPIQGFDNQVLNQYVQQRNLLAKAINELIPKNVYDGYGDSAMFSAMRTAVGPVHALLAIEGEPWSAGSWLNLSVYGSDGQQIIDQGWSFGDTFKPSDYRSVRAKAEAAGRLEKDVTLTPAEIELATRATTTQTTSKPLGPEATELLGRPEEHDPFSVCFSTILLSQAEQEGRNLIASAADDQWRLPVLADKIHAKPSRYELGLTLNKRAGFDRPEGWLVVRSISPAAATEQRIDRTALGTFTRAWIAKRYVSLEDWATLAPFVQPYDEPTLIWDYWNLLRGQMGMDYVNSWDGLRLYGALTPDQLSQLGVGGSLTFRSLSAAEQDALRRIVYETGSLRSRGPVDNSKAGLQSVEYQGGPPLVEGIDGEPTESVPEGIPQNAGLTARITEQTKIYAKQNMAGGITRQMDLSELATWLVQSEKPLPGDDDDMFVQSVRIGVSRTITFDLALTDKIEAETRIQEDRYQTEPIAPKDLKEKLPPDVWAKLEKAMQVDREQRKRMGAGSQEPPTATPPPR